MRRRFALITVAIVTAGGLVLTLAASAKGAEPRNPGETTQPEAKEGSAGSPMSKVRRTEVCFTVHVTGVHVIGDPRAHQVSGTLFHKKGYRGGGTALLLQHGGVSERSVWDGVPGGVSSMAAQLAEAGYVVFAIDRLGYARSPYEPGSGWALTMDSYVEMTREMVAQIREGTYRITDDTCEGGGPAGRPADKVALAGISSGAAINELYATRYHDIDGIVSLMWSSANSSSAFYDEVIFPDVVQEQWAQGKDYIYLFSVENGYSQTCERWLFYDGGVSEDVIKHICGSGYFGGDVPRLMPSGELSDLIGKVVAAEFRDRIGNVGPTPVLKVYAEHDIMHPRNGLGNELQMWSDECNCDFDVLWQRNAGHFGMAHDSAIETTASIIEWLRTGELPEPSPADPPKHPVPTPPCPTSETFSTLGLDGKHEDATPPIPGSVTSFNYRLDVSGSPVVQTATLATIRVTLTWDDLSDFDVFVYDSAGSEIGRSQNWTVQTDRGIETILHFDTAHCTDLRVDIVGTGLPSTNIDLDLTVSDLEAKASGEEER